MPDPVYTIRLTNDPAHYAAGAAIMTATDPWITLDMGPDRCRVAFDGPDKEIYFAFDGETIAGFAIIQTAGSFRGYIQTLCAAAGYRGKGVGTALLQFCEKRIHQFSPNVFMCVSSFNKSALALYLRYGFEQVGLLKDFGKRGFDEILLRKSIGSWNDFIKGK